MMLYTEYCDYRKKLTTRIKNSNKLGEVIFIADVVTKLDFNNAQYFRHSEFECVHEVLKHNCDIRELDSEAVRQSKFLENGGMR